MAGMLSLAACLVVSTAGAVARGALPEDALLIEHWDGSTWTQQSAPQPALGGSSLSSVVAFSRTNVWAVGSGVTLPQSGVLHGYPLAEHWIGTSWRSMTLPTPKQAGFGLDLVGIAGSSPGNVWAVGSDGTHSLFEHWNGHKWRLRTGKTTTGFGPAGVAVFSKKLAWVVGSAQNAKGRSRTWTFRWNGSSWRRVGSPNPSGAGGDDQLKAVSGFSARNVWAVGDDKKGSATRTLVLHWDGSHWRHVTSPSPAAGRNAFLNGVVADGRKSAWAVGAYRAGGTQRPLVEHWDGRRWRVVSAPRSSPTAGFDVLNGVAADSAKDVWAVGDSGPGQAFSEHWDGNSWKVVPVTEPVAFDALSSVAAVSSHDVWAVGLINSP